MERGGRRSGVLVRVGGGDLGREGGERGRDRERDRERARGEGWRGIGGMRVREGKEGERGRSWRKRERGRDGRRESLLIYPHVMDTITVVWLSKTTDQGDHYISVTTISLHHYTIY